MSNSSIKAAEFQIIAATSEHLIHVPQIVQLIEDASKVKGTGIALRSAEYITKKINENKAVIALYNEQAAGFCYIETWENKKYVANSGLIVSDKFRKAGLASKIKEKAFELSRQRYPNSQIFGLTTSLAVMKINSALGYVPVTFSEITQDDEFWKGCETCNYYDILQRTDREKCLCTGMLFTPNPNKIKEKRLEDKQKREQIFYRWARMKINKELEK